MPAPDLTAVKVYLGDSSSATDAEISNALSAETAAQAAVCRVPEGAWPADLTEALQRRVARNLYMKSIPSGVQAATAEAAVSTIRIGSDPEVRRLEAPYRRVPVG